MDLRYRSILTGSDQLGPYPLEKVPKAETITSERIGPSTRRDAREHILARFARGDFGAARTMRTIHNPAGRPLFHMVNHIVAMEENPVAPEKASTLTDPHIAARHIKKYAYFLGADMAGICRVPPETVYSHDALGNPLALKYEYAVVFLIRKDPETELATFGNEWVDDPASWAIYQRLALLSVTLSDYIRGLGYEAEASCCGHYRTLMPRLVVEAGLGEFSRAGIALNPFVGMNFKAACVLCNLPMECDSPIDFGLRDYCSQCGICAQQCCSRAIPEGEKTAYNGYITWQIDEKRCAAYTLTHTGGDVCQKCTIVCPFNRLDNLPEHFRSWNGDLPSLYDSVNRQRAYLESHNFKTQHQEDGKWWLPLRYRDGVPVEVEESP